MKYISLIILLFSFSWSTSNLNSNISKINRWIKYFSKRLHWSNKSFFPRRKVSKVYWSRKFYFRGRWVRSFTSFWATPSKYFQQVVWCISHRLYKFKPYNWPQRSTKLFNDLINNESSELSRKDIEIIINYYHLKSVYEFSLDASLQSIKLFSNRVGDNDINWHGDIG